MLNRRQFSTDQKSIDDGKSEKQLDIDPEQPHETKIILHSYHTEKD